MSEPHSFVNVAGTSLRVCVRCWQTENTSATCQPMRDPWRERAEQRIKELEGALREIVALKWGYFSSSEPAHIAERVLRGEERVVGEMSVPFVWVIGDQSFEDVWKVAESDLIEHGCSLAGFKAWAWLGLRYAATMEGHREGYKRGLAAARAELSEKGE